MVLRVTSWLRRPWLLRTLLLQGRLAVRLLREPRVPLTAKSLPVLATLYVLSPLDAVPDFLPILGQVDDLSLMLLSLALFLRLCPAAAVVFHRTAIAQGRPYKPMSPTDDVIEAEWRSG
jgi:uncharacterized membrane protein YkvA (DUF1232 family)